LAFHKGDPFLHPEEGYEKERQVVIRSFEPALIEAAGTARSGLIVQNNGFGLDARNKEAHVATRDQDSVKRCERGCNRFPGNASGNL